MLSKEILSPGDDLGDAFVVRKQVFVEEQGFSAELEIDDKDAIATHAVFFDDGVPIATGRVFFEADKPEECILGRIAVIKAYRGTGLGRKLTALLEEAACRLGAVSAKLSAQCAARKFYENCGYAAYGSEYLDEHCPHICMRKQL